MVELSTDILTPASQVALIMALAEVCKTMGVPSKYIPILDIVFGIFLGLIVHVAINGGSWANGIFFGLAQGLAACGLFSGVKNLMKKE